MTDNTLVVVGDDYANFADQEGVLTLTSMYEKLLSDQNWPDKSAQIIMGQGISYHDREFLTHTLKKRKVNQYFPIAKTASLNATHKRSDENVLITDFRKCQNKHYQFDLSLTDKVDRLSDHVTGKHVGAMLLMEAARQATIAVLEDEYCQVGDNQYGLILDRFDSQFTGYLFPLPTTLSTSIEELRSSSKNITVVVKTSVSQCGVEIANISLDVTLCVSKVLNKIESRRAQGAIKELHQHWFGETPQNQNIA